MKRFILPFVLLTLVACGDSNGNGTGPDPNEVASVGISPANSTIEVGQTIQLQAEARNAEGTLVSASVSWSSGSPAVASVSGTGLVTGLGAGAAVITAGAGDKSGSATVLVVDLNPPVAPSDVSATALSNTEAEVTWTDNSNNEDEFRIDREEVTSGVAGTTGGESLAFAQVGSVGANVTTFTDTGLASGSSYRYRVRACNGNGCVEQSGSGSGSEVTTYSELVIETTSLPDGVLGQAYQQTLLSSGGNESTTWSLFDGTLPDGITLDAAGVLSGTPSATGTFDFTVQAAGGGQTVTQALSISVFSLSITTTSVPNGMVGSAYSAGLEVTGGDGSYAWAVTAGALPNGLVLSASSGVISGIPTAAGTFNFTTQVTSAGLSDSVDLTITIYAPLAVTTASLPAGFLSVAYSAGLNASGGDGNYTWSLVSGSLPAGLALASNGTISGTPTAGGTSNFTVRVQSGDGQTADAAFSITVSLPVLTITTASLPAGRVGLAYTQTLSATGGDGTYAWAITGGALPGGLALNGASGNISGAPTAAGTFNFTVQVTSGGETDTANLSITVYGVLNVTTASLPNGGVATPYSANLTATGGNGAYTWSIAAGALPAGLTLATSGTISGTPTTSGTSNFTARVQSGDGQTAVAALSITIDWLPVTITTTTLPSGIVGTAYSQTLAATGGDGTYAWAITGGALPGGLSLNPGSGVISGTPTTPGTFNFTVQATSAGLNDTQNLSITITPALAITTTTLPGGTVGTAYSQTLAATGGDGTYTWSLASGTLPGGLSLAAGTGVISGTPTTAGTSNFTVQVASAGQTDTQALSITINWPPVTVTTASLPGGQVATAYSQTLTATGGDGTYTWDLAAGSLPPGLSLVAGTGVISGTPTTDGTYNFTARATSAGLQGTKALSITIGSVLNISTTTLPDGAVGTAYNQTLTATGGDGTYAWSIISGSLPAGLSLAGATGVISGMPTTIQTANFTVQVASAGETDTQALSINIVAGALNITTTSLPDGLVGIGYLQTLTATGGDGTYAWSITVGSLPAGLSLAGATGVISGTPTTVETANFTVQVASAGLTDIQALSINVSTWDCASQSQIPLAECQALEALYNATNGPGWTNSTGWLASTTPCDWYGVGCDAGNTTVTGLMMDSNNMTGSLPAALQNLTNLYEISMPWNNLSGALPTELGTLTNLVWIRLFSNNLSGTIPVSWNGMTSLQYLRLYSNSLSGAIPDLSGTSLLDLDVADNGLTGGIPASIGSISTLQTLDLSLNSLGGSIPAQIANLTNLWELNAYSAGLTGTIPTELGSMTALENLILYDNGLSGSIPTSMGGMTSLGRLQLQGNALTGAIPTELSSLANLWNLYLQGNDLSGLLPLPVAQKGGQMQVPSITRCDIASYGNAGLSMTDNQDYRDADLDRDGFICYLGGLNHLTITTTTLPGGTVGTAYSQTVTAINGSGGYTWSLPVGTLPAGLSLDTSTGEISGTPTTPVTENFTIQVDSGDGQTDTADLSITIVAAPPQALDLDGDRD
ncbi:putative Ig domain-containing protein [Gemmatimonadota bacterium]